MMSSDQPNSKNIRIPACSKPGDDQATIVARTVLEPITQAAATLSQYGKEFGQLDLPALIDILTEQTEAVEEGDLSRSEAMLTSQAHTLDAIFNHMARRALNAEYVDNLDRYLKLALRTQSQCRATWEAVSAIKNPPVAGYVHQANIANGPQQVNNASKARNAEPRAGENQNMQNEVLEKKDGEWLDAGTAGAPSRVDPAMATVGKVDRAKDGGG